MKFNINRAVTVKLTEVGKQILRDNYNSFAHYHPSYEERYPWREPWDSEGYYRTQLWSLMQDFGPSVHLGMEVPFGTLIELHD